MLTFFILNRSLFEASQWRKTNAILSGQGKEAENNQTSVKRARSMIHPQHKVSHCVTAWFGLLPMKKFGASASGTHSILS